MDEYPERDRARDDGADRRQVPVHRRQPHTVRLRHRLSLRGRHTRTLSGLVVAATTALAVVALAAGSGSAEPILSFYPPDARAVGGGDPFAAAPSAVECSRNHDRGPGLDFTPLRGLRRERIANPFVTGPGVSSVVLRYQNKKKQTFRIFLSARTANAIEAFVKTSATCLEALELKKKLPRFVRPVQFDALLLEVTYDTGLSQDTLVKLRDQAKKPPTLRSLVEASGRHFNPVAIDAAAQARTQLEDRVSAGELTQSEVEALDTLAIMSALGDQRGIPFLFPRTYPPRDAAALGASIRSSANNLVVVGVTKVGVPPNLNFVYQAVEQAKLLANSWTQYVNRCLKTATVGVRSWAGSETFNLSRPTLGYNATATATASSGALVTLSHFSSTVRPADTRVCPSTTTSSYSIYNGWQSGADTMLPC